MVNPDARAQPLAVLPVDLRSSAEDARAQQNGASLGVPLREVKAIMLVTFPLAPMNAVPPRDELTRLRPDKAPKEGTLQSSF